MINKTIRLLLLGIFLSAGVHAQSVQEGIRAFNSDRLDDAMGIFQKLSDKAEGAYWQARVLLQERKFAEARTVVSSGLAAQPNNPLLTALSGEYLLMDKKPQEAKQAFDAAIAATRTKRSAGDAKVLNAVGRAIVQTYTEYKNGDLNFAIQCLEAAVNELKGVKEKNRDTWLLADAYSNLGDAYRMARPGEGSHAFAQYQNAAAANSGYGKAIFRMAQIFKSQRNHELFQEYLNKAIIANPTYLPAYYELYAYKLGTADYNGAQQIAEKIKQNTPGNPNNEYFSAQTYYVNKQYDQAIASAKKVIETAKDRANPSAYKVIAYSLIDKKDSAAAIPYVDEYFKKQRPEGFVPKDYTLKVMAYSAVPGNEALLYDTYLDGLKADTVLENRIDLLEDGAKFFLSRNKFELAGDMYAKLIEIKPAERITINDYFNAGVFGYYRAGDYAKAWKFFDIMRTKYADMNYGYLWAYNCSSVFDSINAKNIMVPDAEKLIAFSQKDSAKDAKANLFRATYGLAMYYANEAKDNATSLKYFQMASDASTDESVKQQLADIIKQLSGAVNNTPAPSSTKQPVKPKGGR